MQKKNNDKELTQDCVTILHSILFNATLYTTDQSLSIDIIGLNTLLDLYEIILAEAPAGSQHLPEILNQFIIYYVSRDLALPFVRWVSTILTCSHLTETARQTLKSYITKYCFVKEAQEDKDKSPIKTILTALLAHSDEEQIIKDLIDLITKHYRFFSKSKPKPASSLAAWLKQEAEPFLKLNGCGLREKQLVFKRLSIALTRLKLIDGLDTLSLSENEALLLAEEEKHPSIFKLQNTHNRIEANIEFIASYVRAGSSLTSSIAKQFDELIISTLSLLDKSQTSLLAIVYFNQALIHLIADRDEKEISKAKNLLKEALDFVKKHHPLDYTKMQEIALLTIINYYEEDALKIDLKERLRDRIKILINQLSYLLEVFQQDDRATNKEILLTAYTKLLFYQISIVSPSIQDTWDEIMLNWSEEPRAIEAVLNECFLKLEDNTWVTGNAPLIIFIAGSWNKVSDTLFNQLIKHFKQYFDESLLHQPASSYLGYLVDAIMKISHPDFSSSITFANKMKTFFSERSDKDEEALNKLEEWIISGKPQAKMKQIFIEKHTALKQYLSTEQKIDYQAVFNQIETLFSLIPKINIAGCLQYPEVFFDLCLHRAIAYCMLAYDQPDPDKHNHHIKESIADFQQAMIKAKALKLSADFIPNKIIRLMQSISDYKDQKDFILNGMHSLLDILMLCDHPHTIEQGYHQQILYYEKINDYENALIKVQEARKQLSVRYPKEYFYLLYTDEMRLQEKIVQETETIDKFTSFQQKCPELLAETQAAHQALDKQLMKLRDLIIDFESYKKIFDEVSHYIHIIEANDQLIKNKISILKQHLQKYSHLQPTLEKLLLSMEATSNQITEYLEKSANLLEKINFFKEKAAKLLDETLDEKQSQLKLANQTIHDLSEKKQLDDQKSINISDNLHQARVQLDIAHKISSDIYRLETLKNNFFLPLKFSLRKKNKKTDTLIKMKEATQKIEKDEKKEANKKKSIDRAKKHKLLEKQINETFNECKALKNQYTQAVERKTPIPSHCILAFNKLKETAKKLSSKNNLKKVLPINQLLEDCEELREVNYLQKIEQQKISDEKAKMFEISSMIQIAEQIINSEKSALTDEKMHEIEENQDSYVKLLMKMQELHSHLSALNKKDKTLSELLPRIKTIEATLFESIEKIKNAMRSQLKKKKNVKKPTATTLKPSVSSSKFNDIFLKTLFPESKNNPETVYEITKRQQFVNKFDWFEALITNLLATGIKEVSMISSVVALVVAQCENRKINFPKKIKNINLSLEYKSQDELEKIQEVLFLFGFYCKTKQPNAYFKKFSCDRYHQNGQNTFDITLTNKETYHRTNFSYLKSPAIVFKPKASCLPQHCIYQSYHMSNDFNAYTVDKKGKLKEMFATGQFDTGLPDLDIAEEYSDRFLTGLASRTIYDFEEFKNTYRGSATPGKNAQDILFNYSYIKNFYAKRHANFYLKDICYYDIADLIKGNYLEQYDLHLKAFLAVIIHSHYKKSIDNRTMHSDEFNRIAENLLPFFKLIFSRDSDRLESREQIVQKLYFAIKFICKHSLKLANIDLDKSTFTDFHHPEKLFYRHFKSLLADKSTSSVHSVLREIEDSYEETFSKCLHSVITRTLPLTVSSSSFTLWGSKDKDQKPMPMISLSLTPLLTKK